VSPEVSLGKRPGWLVHAPQIVQDLGGSHATEILFFPRALLDMKRRADAYEREYAIAAGGRAIRLRPGGHFRRG
jgi:hypothetical protein